MEQQRPSRAYERQISKLIEHYQVDHDSYSARGPPLPIRVSSSRRVTNRERQTRVEDYRIAFLQRQIERKREIGGLSSLIAGEQGAEDNDPALAELIEFARLYRKSLEARIAPPAIAERIAALQLMGGDVLIYDAKRVE